MSTFGLFILVRVDFEIIGDVNSPNDQYIAVLFNLASRFTNKPAFTGGDSARFQRAT
jgi:hypothetical protein